MAEATVREHLVVRISSLKNELTRAEELGHISSSTFDYLRYKSELLYEHAVRLSPTDSSNVAYNEVLFKLRQVAIILRELEPTDEQVDEISNNNRWWWKSWKTKIHYFSGTTRILSF